jgi:SM-20-related protein
MMTVLESTIGVAELPSVSFRSRPVVVVENFWSAEERRFFREGMNKATWKQLSDLENVQQDFPNSGNWAKAEIGSAEGEHFLSRLQLPCIREHVESFPNIIGRHIGFSYYSYSAGDCLLTHDDTDQGRITVGRPSLRRRIAVVSYLHEEWKSDWGGELIIYARRAGRSSDSVDLVPTQCIEPRPGTLVMFTVPRYHRICRVDLTAGPHRRLSIAGWFMTEHA